MMYYQVDRKMKISYDKETDSMYIILIDIKGVDSFEIAPDYIVDVDKIGNIIGMEVLNVKNKVDFNELILNKMPFNNVNFVQQ